MSFNKNGVINTDNLIECDLNKFSINKDIKENIYKGYVNIYTNKNGTISSKTNNIVISADTIKSLIGQTLYCSYEVSALGDRSSVEQGQTAYNYVRYGIHASVIGYDASGNATQYYPFTDNLTYSGDKKIAYGYWTVPNKDHFNNMTFAIQNYDKPASTNNNIWFLKNLKLEVNNHLTPFIFGDYNISNTQNAITSNEFIEI